MLAEFGTEHYLLLGSLVILAGILAGKVGYKFGIPGLLLFLFTGMIFGSSGLGIKFDDAGVAQFTGMVALSVILFSGGMDTKIREIRPVLREGVTLSTLGVILTTLSTGLFVYLLSYYDLSPVHISLPAALLLAALMSSTDSASVFAILRSQKMHLKENLKPALELESGSNDPMAYMLTLALIQYIGMGQADIAVIAGELLLQFALGCVLGYIFGKISVFLLNRINIENDMIYPIILLCLVFVTFSLSSLFGGNGYLTIYIAGIVVGNSRLVHKKSIITFFDGITWLVQIILFILLGLLVNPSEMLPIAGFALATALFLIFVGRPLSVLISLLPFRKLSFRGRIYLSWVGLRGAVPIIFATYPILMNIPEAKILFNVVFFITIVSLLIQGSTVSSAARWLGLAIPSSAEGNLFGVEIPEETGTTMEERIVTEEMISAGDRLMDIDLDEKELVILISRHGSYRVPKGPMHLQEGDILLIVSEQDRRTTDKIAMQQYPLSQKTHTLSYRGKKIMTLFRRQLNRLKKHSD
ncbi:potassium/proton antiporter [Porphyromonas crevioricanis]|uniref:Potassium/proton antiporter n=2 Tax=Porphyromonas crevioricanis TaxID=393921 RepID=A0A2X4PMI7_9PORP|nr:potassium/proton antiporter [Porphyromonas crevioricanis]GAD05513.1 Na(+)/H(+) antiporter [Porphyromonas crevioricanis JCM 15906]GAD07740.1 Na(+)/H(+) antiporter [Porphyromonas crevioricanis JCM 13913]SJZ93626.1 potassium/proton antiporter, CPA1 family (TC 2.A.36) [Porphyromonas crevioricanis]SQH73585.1 potassium/proton antiporter [Porphyromonas crevioricanis]